MRRIKKGDIIGMIVAADIETARVFNYYGLDFFSKGNRTLEEACINDNVPIVSLLDDLSKVGEAGKRAPDFLNMSIRSLAHYILRKHHRFAESRLIYIKHALNGILKEFTYETDIITPIKSAFDDLSLQLTIQMNYEEFLIYPAIEKMTRKNKAVSSSEHRKIMQHLRYMKEESSKDVTQFKIIADVTRNYTNKGQDEALYDIAYRSMKELEEDVKIHMHLENNVLCARLSNYIPMKETARNQDQREMQWFNSMASNYDDGHN